MRCFSLTNHTVGTIMARYIANRPPGYRGNPDLVLMITSGVAAAEFRQGRMSDRTA